jgi:formylglycine-generating enzyme required for sulfatase activity
LGWTIYENDRGCFANFKPNREIMQQIRHCTVEAKSYEPNGYNLYNMAGNVSEWTDSSYDPNAYEYVSSMNPNVLDASNKRKEFVWFLERRCLFPTSKY